MDAEKQTLGASSRNDSTGYKPPIPPSINFEMHIAHPPQDAWEHVKLAQA